MERLYKTYVASLCSIILGQLILSNRGTTPNYIVVAIILVILFSVSIKPELMNKKEFLFSQFMLMIVLIIFEVIVICFTISIKEAVSSLITYPLYLIAFLLQVIGCISAFVCIIKYKVLKIITFTFFIGEQYSYFVNNRIIF